MKIRMFGDGSAQFLPEEGDPEHTPDTPKDFPKHPEGVKLIPKGSGERPWALSADEQVKRGISTAAKVARATVRAKR